MTIVNSNVIAKATEAVIDAMIDAGSQPDNSLVMIAGTVAVTKLGALQAQLRDEILNIEDNLEALVATGRNITQGELIEILKMVGRISTKGDSY